MKRRTFLVAAGLATAGALLPAVSLAQPRTIQVVDDTGELYEFQQRTKRDGGTYWLCELYSHDKYPDFPIECVLEEDEQELYVGFGIVQHSAPGDNTRWEYVTATTVNCSFSNWM